ncbi:MAG: sigma-70 family RNA polymerase sigma factor [Acidobacteria bacterium]|nr:sigma-70 family RNA polymerase sigma factor [Acidobacteriota bacterium]
MQRVGPELAARLHRRANAGRWDVPVADFAAALERSAAKVDAPDATTLERALGALHLEDLALACACERGHEAAWEHFVLEYRPALYRAAAAIDSAGDGRELADSLYGELFGLRERDGERQSLFRYFHGRSSLGTWLRAILAQRHVDRVRAIRRFEPLPEENAPDAPASEAAEPDVESHRLGALVRAALAAALARLPPRDRLRLGWYYAQDMTLAQIGRALKEHEATVSRHLTRTRKALREDVERQLQERGLSHAAVAEGFAAVVADAGEMDVADLLGTEPARKNAVLERSLDEGMR